MLHWAVPRDVILIGLGVWCEAGHGVCRGVDGVKCRGVCRGADGVKRRGVYRGAIGVTRRGVCCGSKAVPCHGVCRGAEAVTRQGLCHIMLMLTVWRVQVSDVRLSLLCNV